MHKSKITKLTKAQKNLTKSEWTHDWLSFAHIMIFSSFLLIFKINFVNFYSHKSINVNESIQN